MAETGAAATAPEDRDSVAVILDAAATCFMERGFQATSIDDVADRLGSTKGRIYHYFRSKTDLFFAVHREGLRRIFEAVEPAMAMAGQGAEQELSHDRDRAGATAAARLEAMLRAQALCLMDNIAYETVVVQGLQMHLQAATTPAQRHALDELVGIRDGLEALFRRVLEAGVADGSLRAEDPSVVVKAALGAVNWITIWYRPRDGESEADRVRIAGQIVATVMSGVKPR